MKIYKPLLVIFLLFGIATSGQESKIKDTLSSRTSSYDIKLRLNVETKQIYAEQKLTFINPSADTIWDMPFHMYYNAFKNNKTTFQEESTSFLINKNKEDVNQGIWSWIKVIEIIDAKGNNLSDSINYIALDDQNINDHTVLNLRLKSPILPYQSYVLNMKWESKIPRAAIRTGYNKKYYFMAQWFPKLGVYEPAGSRFATKGAWNCHQYHANTEYFGEFGNYNVEITLPKEYVVGATGNRIKKQEQNNLQTLTYVANDVVDFAWTANPEFIELKDQWKHVEIKLLVMPEHECNQDRFFKAAKNTLDFFQDYLGPYPFNTLTIVSPPYYGLFSSAMEYPTLFTAPTLCILPENLRTTETITIHELTHQYFMQIIATNEQEEAWMDEGFTSFFEAKIMDIYYPKGVLYWDLIKLKIGANELRRGRFFNAKNIKIGPLSDFGWHFVHGGHREIVYGKASLILRTLEGLVGEKCMREIMRIYYQRWQFKHPCRNDFIDIVNETVPKYHDRFGTDMNAFLNQAIFGTDECDYAVASVETKKIEERLGIFNDQEHAILPNRNINDDFFEYETKTIIHRLGEFIVPQEVKITFDNGNIILENWDGKSRSHDFTYRGLGQIISVEIDPNRKIPIDKNLINNSYTVEPKSKGLYRYLISFITWLQTAMLSISSLV
ncbi:MAG: M1 family metallopeptidase [Saprospiraceae bacterium]|nr:M1 family metallopeptidase [Saprospiraceae bacterium]